MFSLNDLVRENEPFSIKAVKATFFWPEVFYASSLSDFLENRDTIGSLIQDKWKWNVAHHYLAGVCIQSCRYERGSSPLEPMPAKKWQSLRNKIYVDFRIRSIKEGTPFNRQQMEKEFFDRLKNSQLYDAASAYPVMARMPIPLGVTIYDIWLKYLPGYDFAQIESFDRHGTHSFEERLPDAEDIATILLPKLQPA